MDVSSLLKLMDQKKASDLFITAGLPPSIKIDGHLAPVTPTPLSPQDTAEIVAGMMTPAQRDEFEATHECNFAISESGVGRFRASAFYQRGQIGVVLRRIETYIPSIEELKLPPILKNLSMTKRGLIIFIGATGTGKSTTLAAMINHRNEKTSSHIITIEDPIEFLHPNKQSIVNQREVGLDTRSYHRALKSAMRGAPDVIQIGEIRDTESMRAALDMAGTGHLVLATVHSNNAPETLDRIINLFPQEQHGQVYMDLACS